MKDARPVCKQCGEPAQGGDRYCGRCGQELQPLAAPQPATASLPPEPVAEPAAPASPAPPKVRPRRRWLILAGLLVLLIAGPGLNTLLSILHRPSPYPQQPPATPTPEGPQSPDAIFQQAESLLQAPDEQRDLGRAFRLYAQAAQQGHLDAMDRLGLMYANGWGVQADLEQAIAWWLRAAEQGHANSQYNLGCAYLERRVSLAGGPPMVGFDDYQRSVQWLRAAAAAGHALAHEKLQTMGIQP